jgi:A/G-specific adenine glycosylase
MRWYDAGRRDLPWRRTRDPYGVWVSEIMLQQTRVEAVMPYYERFLRRFPNVEALAGGAEHDLLAAWGGLGYYSRARNLQKAARLIVERGSFPDTYESLRELPGIGGYTAAAIASIAFDLPHAVLDGNVMRVLARLTNDNGDIKANGTRQRLQEVAGGWLDPQRPGTFNQALMELGATICTPRAPDCAACPVRGACQAHRLGTQRDLPVKRAGPAKRRIEKTLYVIERRGKLVLWQRPPGSPRMAGFWELPDDETLPNLAAGDILGRFRHTITNHNYVFTVRIAPAGRLPAAHTWWDIAALPLLPLSTTARKALRLRR